MMLLNATGGKKDSCRITKGCLHNFEHDLTNISHALEKQKHEAILSQINTDKGYDLKSRLQFTYYIYVYVRHRRKLTGQPVKAMHLPATELEDLNKNTFAFKNCHR